MKKNKIEISILNEYEGFEIATAQPIEQIFSELFEMKEVREKLKKYKFDTISCDVVFCNDDTIRQINREYRGIDSATDVISFALFMDDEGSKIIDKKINLGEIIISIDTAVRQAKNGLDDEILTLVTHGALHLLGFDHLTEEDYEFICETQCKIISKLLFLLGLSIFT